MVFNSERIIKRDHSALKMRLYPLFKDWGTINWKLDGKKANGKTANLKKEHLRILTCDEECSVVEFMKNKNRCHQGITQKHIMSLILYILKIRDIVTRKLVVVVNFKNYISANARCVLQIGKYVYIPMFFL